MVHTATLSFDTKGHTDVIDITGQVADVIAQSGLRAGVATVFVAHSTAAITTIEHEPGLVKDIGEALERVAPEGVEYHHNERWHDDNGHAHLRSSLVGPSLVVPFTDSRLALGTWQQIVLLDFDNRPRARTVVVQVLGE